MMARQQRLPTLRNNPDLARFVIEGEANGGQLGAGSYGSVEEIVTNGLVCAGKKIHEVLLDPGNEGVRDIAGRYVQERQLMSDLRHPNITQFMGVCFLPDCQLPVLLMERLDESLDDLLETIPNIPLVIKRSILEDVSRGLLYLHKHTPQIIHRDLTAKNVLLTSSLVAKITDFGNARIVNLQPGQLVRTLSRLPGMLAYMPPEALSANARYGSSLDVFSFGHLALFTLNQIFPGDLLEHNYPDPESPDRLTGRTEVERRGQYFESLERRILGCRQHQPLVQLVKVCLHNTPSRRPSTEQVLQALEDMKAIIEGPYGKFAKLDAVKQVAIMKDLKGREKDVRVKTDELAAKDGEIQQLQQQLEQAQVQIQQKSDLLDRISIELQHRDEELQLKDAEYQATLHQINLTHQHLLEEKQTFISQQQMQLETLQTELRAAHAQIQQLLSEQSRFDTPQVTHQTATFNELDVPLRLQWRKGTEMILGMSFYPQAVVMNGKVYVGGGDCAHKYDLNTVVAVYDPGQDQWSRLAKYDFQYFAMTVVNGELMLLGGRNQSETMTTSIIQIWDEKRQGWVYYLPNLPVACDAATAVTYEDKWLIVAGGRSHTYESLSVVNILDLHTHRWHSGAHLPNPCRKMTAAVIDKTMVLLGGAVGEPGNRSASVVFSVELDQLISQAVSHDSNLSVDESPWQILPNTPVASSTALALNGALLAVGGGMLDNDSSSTYSSPIYLYKFNSGSNTWSWIEAGCFPVRRVRCACTVLPSGEIFVAGGTIGREPIQDVRIATLEQKYQ